MSRLVRCNHCGAPVSIENGQTAVTCMFCQHALPTDALVASVERPAPSGRESYRAGEAVLVEWHGKFWPAHVLSVEGENAWKIHYDGYSSSWDETVGPERIEPRGATVARAGSPSFYLGIAAAVLLAIGAIVAIAGGSRSGDQGSSATEPAGTHAPGAGEKLDDGRSIFVSWNGRWYAATVLSDEGPLVRIHYTGWSSSWDEAVTRDRIRLP